MPGLLHLALSHGAALAPAGFHRVTRGDGSSAELNRPPAGGRSATTASFLWVREHEGLPPGSAAAVGEEPGSAAAAATAAENDAGEGVEDAPIVDVTVVPKGEAPPEGFMKQTGTGDKKSAVVRAPLKGGAVPGMVLCVKRSWEVDPIGAVVVLFEDADDAVPEGYERLDVNINPHGAPTYLAVRRVSKDGPPKFSGFALEKGDWLDAKDQIGNWCVAQVVDCDADSITVHYKGWAEKWNSTIQRNASSSIAELGSHTKGKDTGYSKREQGTDWEVTIDMIENVREQIKDSRREGDNPAAASSSSSSSSSSSAVAGMAAAATAAATAAPEGEDTDLSDSDRFWQGDLGMFLESCLSSRFTDPTVLPHVNGLIHDVLEELVGMLKFRAPLPAHWLSYLNRILDNDKHCTFYYETYGYGERQTDAALVVQPRDDDGVGNAEAVANAGEEKKSASDADNDAAEDSPKNDIMETESTPRTSNIIPGQSYDVMRVGKFAIANERQGVPSVSRLYVTVLNWFGNMGGFDAILDRLSAVPTQPDEPAVSSLTELRAFVDVLARAKYLYMPAFRENYFAQFEMAVYARLGRLTSQDLQQLQDCSNSVQAASGTVDVLCALLNIALIPVFPDDELPTNVAQRKREIGVEVAQRAEQFWLEFCHKFLTCQRLKLRIDGMQTFGEVISLVRRKETRLPPPRQNLGYGAGNRVGAARGSASNARTKDEPTVKWLTSDYLATWMQENHVVEIALGEGTAARRYNVPDTHMELVTRVAEVVFFLAEKQQLTSAQIGLIWKLACSTRAGQQMQKAALNMLSSLLTRVDHSTVVLITRITASYVAAYTPSAATAASGSGGDSGNTGDKNNSNGNNAAADDDADWIPGDGAALIEMPAHANLLEGHILLLQACIEAVLRLPAQADEMVGLWTSDALVDLLWILALRMPTAQLRQSLARAEQTWADALRTPKAAHTRPGSGKEEEENGAGEDSESEGKGREAGEQDTDATADAKQEEEAKADAEYRAFWQVRLDNAEAGAEDGVGELAMEALRDLVRRPQFNRLVDVYLERCVLSLEDGPCAVRVIQLLRLLIEGFPEARSTGTSALSPRSRAQAIESLNESSKLLQHCVNDVMALTQFAKERHAASSPSGGDVASFVVEPDVTFREAVRSRLDFMEFLLSSSQLLLDSETLNSLWAALVRDTQTSSSSGVMQNTCLTWLAELVPDELTVTRRYGATYAALEQGTVESLWDDLLSPDPAETGLNVEALNKDGYWCIEKAFRILCFFRQKLTHTSQRHHFVVEDLDQSQFPDMSVFHRVLTRANSEDVATTVSEFFVDMSTRTAQNLDKDVAWTGFVSRVRDKMHEVSANDCAQQAQALNRYLVLLRSFLEKVASPLPTVYSGLRAPAMTSGIRAPGASRSNQPTTEQRVSILVRREDGGRVPGPRAYGNRSLTRTIVYLFRRGTVTVGQLRSRLARDLGVHPTLIRVLNSHRTKLACETYDDVRLDKANILTIGDAIMLKKPEKDTENYKRMPAARTVSEDPDSVQLKPRRVLSDDAATLSVLFALLRRPEVMDNAWQLLELLPTNAAARAEVVLLGRHDRLVAPATAAAAPGDAGADAEASAAAAAGATLDFTSAECVQQCTSILADLVASCQANESSASPAAASTVDWPSLFDGSSPLHLLYRLRIAEGVLNESSSIYVTQEESEFSNAWRRAFVACGGVKHFMRLLLSMDVAVLCATPMTKRCLQLLLKLLADFLQQKSIDEEEDEGVSVPVETTAVAVEEGSDDAAATVAGSGEDGGADSETGGASAAEDGNVEGVAVAKGSLAANGSDNGNDNDKSNGNSNSGNVAISLDLVLGDGVDVNAVVRRLLQVMHKVTPDSEALLQQAAAAAAAGGVGAGGAGAQSAAAGARKSRQALMEEYFREGGAGADQSGGVTSTAMDVIAQDGGGGDDDDDDGKEMDESELSVEARVVKSSIALLVTIVLKEPSLLRIVLEFPELAHALEFSLLQALEAPLRTVVRRGILRMCKQLIRLQSEEGAEPARDGDVAPNRAFGRLLLPFVDKVSSQYRETCLEYFSLMADLQSAGKVARRQDAAVDLDDNVAENPVPLRFAVVRAGEEAEALVLSLAKQIVAAPVREQSEAHEDRDLFLQGMMRLLTAVLAALPIREQRRLKARLDADPDAASDSTVPLVSHLFNDCLFATPTESQRQNSDGTVQSILPPKCKHAVSRGAAFALMSEVARHCDQAYSRVVSLMSQHHSIGETPDERRQRKRRERLKANAKDANKRLAGSEMGLDIFTPKSRSGYSGLRNLGCICYMNSTLQQFYMLPAFRQGILEYEALDDGDDDEEEEDDDDDEGEEDEDDDDGNANANGGSSTAADEQQQDSDSELDEEAKMEERLAEDLMFQLQRMFSGMQESEQSYFDPTQFCLSFKDWDGQPVNPSIQQDASEFMTNFFQQLEDRTMGTDSEGLLKSVFGGVFSNELIAAGSHYSERQEPFYFVSVPVQDNPTLSDALRTFIAGEEVEYTWETVKQGGGTEDGAGGGGDDAGGEGGEPEIVKESLPTTKRVSFKDLPDHLVIHLKRFEFDFNTMQQVKVNQRFEFPNDLDMKPFTVEGRDGAASADSEASADTAATADGVGVAEGAETDQGQDDSAGDAGGRPPEYYMYELSGVVVHMGSAQSGHYYSYIRERDGDRKWYEFNDKLVLDFDAAEVEEECFGGEETVWGYPPSSGGGGMGARSSVMGAGGGYHQQYTREKFRNAFVLVYDRKPQRDATVKGSGSGGAAQNSATGAAESKESDSQQTRGSTAEEEALVRLPRFRARVPPLIMSAIRRDNDEFWRQKFMYDTEYYGFMMDLVTQPGARCLIEDAAPQGPVMVAEPQWLVSPAIDESGHPTHTARANSGSPEPLSSLLREAAADPPVDVIPLRASVSERTSTYRLPVVRLALRFTLGSLVRARERQLLARWSERLCAALEDHFEGCLWLLQELGTDTATLKELMLVIEDEHTRAAIMSLVTTAIKVVGPMTKFPTNDEEDADLNVFLAAETNMVSRATHSLIRFFNQYMNLFVHTTHLWWRRIQAFFNPITAMAELGDAARAFLLRKHVLKRLLGYLVWTEYKTPEWVTGDPKIAIRDRNHVFVTLDQRGLVIAAGALLRCVKLPAERLRETDAAAAAAGAPSGRGADAAVAAATGAIPEGEPVVEAASGGDTSTLAVAEAVAVEAAAAAPGDAAVEGLELDDLPETVAQLPAQPPGDVERSMIDSPVLAQRFIAQIRTPSRVEVIQPIVCHLVFERQAATMRFVRMISETMKREDGTDLKPAFRAAMCLLDTDDSLLQWRVETVMNTLADEMTEAKRYIQATEHSLRMLHRLAKRSVHVREWFAASAAKLDWVIDWLRRRSVSTYPQGCIMYKPRATGVTSTRTTYAGSGQPRFPTKLLMGIYQQLFDGEAAADSYDSDDAPTRLIGKRVRVKWTETHHYSGTVTEYNNMSGKHKVVYDDGDIREYIMRDKQWQFLAGEAAGATPPGAPPTEPPPRVSEMSKAQQVTV